MFSYLKPRRFLYSMYIILIFLFFCVLVTACKPKTLDYSFPDTGATCGETISWMNLRPGISTQKDVIDILGKPAEKGKSRFYDGRRFSYYAYNVSGGEISKFAQHRIFFRRDSKIDWIEVIVADQDQQFHSVQEITDQLGDTLDTVYNNNNYNPFADFQIDVLSGPDQVYVWSECGFALLALMSYKKTDVGAFELSPMKLKSPWVLELRYPNLFTSTVPVSDLDSIVMMKYIFEPTTFEDFMNNYMHRIPYGLWDDYLDTITGN